MVVQASPCPILKSLKHNQLTQLAIADGFGVYIDGGSSLVSSNNVYDGNTLIGVQSVNGSIEMTGDTVTNSLSTGVWAEGSRLPCQ